MRRTIMTPTVYSCMPLTEYSIRNRARDVNDAAGLPWMPDSRDCWTPVAVDLQRLSRSRGCWILATVGLLWPSDPRDPWIWVAGGYSRPLDMRGCRIHVAAGFPRRLDSRERQPPLLTPNEPPRRPTPDLRHNPSGAISHVEGLETGKRRPFLQGARHKVRLRYSRRPRSSSFLRRVLRWIVNSRDASAWLLPVKRAELLDLAASAHGLQGACDHVACSVDCIPGTPQARPYMRPGRAAVRAMRLDFHRPMVTIVVIHRTLNF